MLKGILPRFTAVLYVQLWEQRIKVVDVNSKQVYDEAPLLAIKTTAKGERVVEAAGNAANAAALNPDTELVNPFSHPRMLLADFQMGEKLLQHAFRVLNKKKLAVISPAVVMHPMEKLAGGLTEIEQRALRELALGAGAREAVVYLGGELSIVGFDYQALKANISRP